MEILQVLGERYAAAAAYRDVGRLVLTRHGLCANRSTVGEFRTAFVRSKGFRFEYREVPAPERLRDPSASRRFCIRVDRGKVVDIHGFDFPRGSVSLAVASMTGSTFGAAHCVLRMLLPAEIEGRALSEAPAAKLVGSDRIDGKRCAVIRLGGWSGADEVLVDEDFALRRVVGVRPAMPGEIEPPTMFTQVRAYDDPQLFTEEPPDMSLDW